MEPFILTNMHYETLNFLTLGHQKCEPEYGFGYAYISSYLIHYVMKGCGTFTKNGITKKVSAGEAFIIKPGGVYSYRADSEKPWEYIWFSFNGKLAQRFETVDDIIKINDSTPIIDMLGASALKNTQMEYLTGKLYEFVSGVFEEKRQTNNHIRAVSDYIKSNYMREITVEEIAKAINLNSKYLTRMFKKEKGISIKEYIIRKKISKAKELLSQGLSVSETAGFVGYKDPFTFSKMFKQYTGFSPGMYAKL